MRTGPFTATETVAQSDNRQGEPTEIFDAHLHIIDPRFPLIPNDGFVPKPFTIAQYRARMNGFRVTGGTVVSGSFQGTDQSHLITSLTELDPGWVGVTQLSQDASDQDIVTLHRKGVRGIRLNLRRAAVDIVSTTQQAIRAHDLVGWHAEMYVDDAIIPSLKPVVSKLPALSIDHLGLSEKGMDNLLDLVDRGAHVKASGFGRFDGNLVTAMRRIHRVNPEALMFGSDLPAARADRPFRPSDIDLIAEAVGDDLPAVLADNARRFYRIDNSSTYRQP